MLLQTISSSPNNQNAVNNNHSFECAVVTGAALAAIGLFTPRSYWFLIGGVVPLLERIMTVGQRSLNCKTI